MTRSHKPQIKSKSKAAEVATARMQFVALMQSDISRTNLFGLAKLIENAEMANSAWLQIYLTDEAQNENKGLAGMALASAQTAFGKDAVRSAEEGTIIEIRADKLPLLKQAIRDAEEYEKSPAGAFHAHLAKKRGGLVPAILSPLLHELETLLTTTDANKGKTAFFDSGLKGFYDYTLRGHEAPPANIADSVDFKPIKKGMQTVLDNIQALRKYKIEWYKPEAVDPTNTLLLEATTVRLKLVEAQKEFETMFRAMPKDTKQSPETQATDIRKWLRETIAALTVENIQA